MSDETSRVLAGVVAAISGTERPNQQQMAAAVSQAVKDESILLIQAGTGTGKSLGYLVPLAVAARKQGLHSVVSTATLALQRQLVGRDLPALVAALPKGERVTFAVLKGRGNYLCRARLAGISHDSGELELEIPSGPLEKQAAALRDWAGESLTGDRDDYPTEIDGRVWRSMSATGKECVGPSKCTFADDCFSENARRRAADVDITVTNHAFLALDAMDDAPLLPDHDVLVIDEAHEFVSRATNAGTAELSPRALERAISLARGMSLKDDTVDRLQEAHDGFEAALRDLATQPSRLKSLPPVLVDPLAAIRDACLLAIAEVPSGQDVDIARRHRVTATLTDLQEVAGRLLAQGANDVAWIVAGANPSVQLAPLSVAETLAPYLREHQAAILTSATLTIGGKFEPMAHELGLLDPQDWEGTDVGSPFNYGEQGILYVAADLARPGREGPDDAAIGRMIELIEAAGGRTLVLLSSWRAVDRVVDGLSGKVKSPLLTQRRGDSPFRLVASFSADDKSVLIGTMSLFQGVDVPGSALTCVIIDRIPFPRPDDPIVAARSELVDAAGGNGFQSVSVPRAALMMAQGSGRLIRSGTDRGVVAVLDSRLATAGYSRTIRQSMPPFWPTTNREVVLESLRRLAAAADQAASEHDSPDLNSSDQDSEATQDGDHLA